MPEFTKINADKTLKGRKFDLKYCTQIQFLVCSPRSKTTR